MLVAKQKLSVEVAEVDRVQVDDVDFAEAGQDEVLEQFASDAASAHHENARLPWSAPFSIHIPAYFTSLIAPCSVPRLLLANVSRAIA